ncbi:hypothetical protein H2198_003539 [Neophaeococcomyces mojaviensis]|uniref:Uncharacterized protein n=1 Tax=Neophaeococcomyces mojaviensis TaxID=3383035 RepID=A0ACC3ABF7_9EURO|nr:hypothetical protein H2198_003539 [Knufia sp. JES_112]
MAEPPPKRVRTEKQNEIETSKSDVAPGPSPGNAFPTINIWGTAQIHQGDQYGTVSERPNEHRIIANNVSGQDPALEEQSRRAGQKDHNPQQSSDNQKAVYDVLFESLIFGRMDARYKNVTPAMPQTCNWLFKHDAFISWAENNQRNAHHGFLWIKGKPGSGKSTIMKEAMKWVKRRRSQTIISFFFNARASHQLEKSTLGLYRSLVCQLLQLDLPCSADNRAFFVQYFRSKHINGTVDEWTINELQEFMIHVSENSGERPLNIFIDALDECDEKEVREMVSFLEDLASRATSSGTNLKICLSSRHYPHVSIRRGQSLIVEDQPEHQQDLTTYIEAKLTAADNPGVTQLRHDLCQKAAGIFLWLVLVIPILNEIHDHGGTLEDMKQQLGTIPGELEGLFTNIIHRNASNRAQFSMLIRWVLYSVRPLSPTELHLAMQCSGKDPTIPFVADEVPDPDTLSRYILNHSRGFTEVTKAQPPVVQFIHETVRDFFLHHKDPAELEPYALAKVVGISHDELKLCCLRYVNSCRVRSIQIQRRYQGNAIERHFPFLQYAVSSVLSHATLAQGSGISQKQFLTSLCNVGHEDSIHGSCGAKLDFPKWKVFHNQFERYKIRHYNENSTLLYILSEKGLLHLVAVLAPPSHSINELTGRYGSALQAACAHGHTKLVAYFIANGADVNIRGGTHDHGFLAAVYHKQYPVIDLLLEQKLSIPQKPLAECLLAMIARSNVRCLKAVIQAGADVNTKNSRGMTALSVATKTRNKEIVKCLLDAGADFNTANDGGRGLVGSCAHEKNFDIANILVEYHAFCGLSLAAQIGNVQMVEQLLHDGVTAYDWYMLDGPLALAALYGHGDVVKLLITSESYLKDNPREMTRALKYAICNANEAIIRILLENGSDIGECGVDTGALLKRRSNDETMLNLAIQRGNQSIVRMLLEYGADPNATVSEQWPRNQETPLMQACLSGDVGIARMLVEKGADLHVHDTEYNSVLIRALDTDQDELACCFIEMGANLSTKNWSLGSALHVALRKARCPKAIKMLKERKAPNISPWTR